MSSPNRAPPPKSLIIIGAGMAGIKLAHTCIDLDPNISITILDSNDYIGGRIRNAEFCDHTIELGANWISGGITTTNSNPLFSVAGSSDNDNDNEDGVNPIWKLAQDIQLQGHESDRDDNVHVIDCCSANGDDDDDKDTTASSSKDKDITSEYVQVCQRFNECYEKAVKLCSEKQIKHSNDIDVKTFLKEYCDWIATTPIEKAVEYNVLEVWVCNDISTLSVAHDLQPNANDVELGRDEYFVEDVRGFNSILNNMIHDIIKQPNCCNILLQHQVQTIDYTTFGNCKVTAVDLAASDTTKEFIADAIVCTVSLGVLKKSKTLTFVPPLPKWKLDALDEIDMFTFSKVFVEFESTTTTTTTTTACDNDGDNDGDNGVVPNPFWWPQNQHQVVLVSEKKGYYPLWMKYRGTNYNNNDNSKNKTTSSSDDEKRPSSIFMCYIGGTEAQRVENLSEEQLKDEIQDLFYKAFGRNINANNMKNTKKSTTKWLYRPKHVKVTDWSRNPNFCGSYSYHPVHSFSKIPFDDLTRGVSAASDDADSRVGDSFASSSRTTTTPTTTTTLYFAGECYDDKFNGWVQGAYLSGERVAKSIMLGSGTQ